MMQHTLSHERLDAYRLAVQIARWISRTNSASIDTSSGVATLGVGVGVGIGLSGLAFSWMGAMAMPGSGVSTSGGSTSPPHPPPAETRRVATATAQRHHRGFGVGDEGTCMSVPRCQPTPGRP